MRVIRQFLNDHDGPTAVEYAVMTMLLFMAVFASVQFFGLAARDSFDNSGSKIEAATNGKEERIIVRPKRGLDPSVRQKGP